MATLASLGVGGANCVEETQPAAWYAHLNFLKQGFGTVLRRRIALFPECASVQRNHGRQSPSRENGKIPAGIMSCCSANISDTVYPGIRSDARGLRLKDYWIDNTRVQPAFRPLSIRSGYERGKLGSRSFQKDGKDLSWNEAMALFQDAAGRPARAIGSRAIIRRPDDFR